MNHTISSVSLPQDAPLVRAIFAEYMGSLDIDLSFQDAKAELAQIPGKYASPRGDILLARDNAGAVIGCIALRPIEIEQACEIKRLYVRPEGRGLGLAKEMIDMVIARARRIGYTSIYLDTLRSMSAARHLYERFGFEEIAAYYETPLADTVFMRLSLTT